MKKNIVLFILFSIALLDHLALAQGKLLVDNFENGLSETWTTKSFQGVTIYSIVNDNGGNVLQAISNGTASGLIFEREFDVTQYPVVSWRWKVENTVEDGDANNRSTDDYAARIYVTFPHWFFPKTTNLNYIWANTLPKGKIQPSPYTANSMMIAVESGQERVGEWIEAHRNIVEDYRQAFGEDPPRKAVIAIMTDTDNTQGKARAWYDDIYLTR